MSAALWSPRCFSAPFAQFWRRLSTPPSCFLGGLKTPWTFQTRRQPPFSPSCRRTAAVDQGRCDITASSQPITCRVYFKQQHFVLDQKRTARRVSLAGSGDNSSAVWTSFPAAGDVSLAKTVMAFKSNLCCVYPIRWTQIRHFCPQYGKKAPKSQIWM